MVSTMPELLICAKMPPVIPCTNPPTEKQKKLLKATYKNDLETRNLIFNGKPVLVRELSEPSGLYNSFDHVTCDCRKKGYNVFDPFRSARLPWIKPIINGRDCNACGEPDYKIFSTPGRNGRSKRDVLIWCTITNFLIILATEKSWYTIISAQCVDYENKIVDLNSQYDDFIKSGMKIT
jgi:hypothetical protein